MKLIGLTGGIASGKSTVRQMLVAHGACVLDADAIYHQLIAPQGTTPSPLALQIASRFPGVLLENGRIDRATLGKRVFASAEERRELETITHPAVARAVTERIDAERRDGRTLLFYDVPLLFERGLERGMDGVIVVWVPAATQIARLMARDGIPQIAAEQRLAAQMPLSQKRDWATWVVDNSGDLSHTRAQVDHLWQALSLLASPS